MGGTPVGKLGAVDPVAVEHFDVLAQRSDALADRLPVDGQTVVGPDEMAAPVQVREQQLPAQTVVVAHA